MTYIKKAKLIWYPSGYKVEHLNWDSYKPFCNGDLIAHDLFEHAPSDNGSFKMEIKATGAKLFYEDICIYRDWRLVFMSYREFLKKYDTPSNRKSLKVFLKGKDSINEASKVICDYWGKSLTLRECRRLMRQGFEYAEQYNPKAYMRVAKTNFVKYNNQNLDLEISLVTGKVLKKLPKSLDK